MSGQKITRLFDAGRIPDNGDLATLRKRVRDLRKIKTGKVLTKESFDAFLDELLKGTSIVLKEQDRNMIFEQLRRSTEGEETDTFEACWDYWLRQKTSQTTALMIVDVQNDFISGSLALKFCPAAEDGYEVISTINDILSQKLFDHIIYTMDWHPPDHCSFIDNVNKYPLHESSPAAASEAKAFQPVVYSSPLVMEQILWPIHCVQNTWGAELHQDLKPPDEVDYISKKGYQSDVDSYSAFWSSGHVYQTDLFKELLKKGVTDVYICGLALDICARFTARDAAIHGFNTYIVEDACRSSCPHKRCQAKDDFNKDGIPLLDSKDLAIHLSNQGGSAS